MSSRYKASLLPRRRVCLYSQQSRFFRVYCQTQNPLKTTTIYLRQLLYSTGLSQVDNLLMPESPLICSNCVLCSNTCVHAQTHMGSLPLYIYGVIMKWLTIELKATDNSPKSKRLFYRAVVQERTASIFTLQHI